MHLTLRTTDRFLKSVGCVFFLTIESAPSPPKKSLRILPQKSPRDNLTMCRKFRGICVSLVLLSPTLKERKCRKLNEKKKKKEVMP